MAERDIIATLDAKIARLRAALAEAEAVWKSERREILLANDSLARERDEARRKRDEALVHVHHGPFVRGQGTEAEHDCETMTWAYLAQERDALRAALRAVVEAAVCVLAICDCISDEDDPKYGVPKTALRAALTEARRVLEE